MNRSLVSKTALLTAAALTLAACGQPKAKAPTPLSIQTTTINQAQFSPVVETMSPLEATANVDLKPSIDGRVVKVLAKDGQPVTAGQVILVLDNVQERASLDAAISKARKDAVNAERYAYLFEQGAVSAKERDRYRTEAIQSQDEAKVDAANLGYKAVRSPINGVIGNLDSVKVGDYVKTGQTITGIVDNTNLWTLMEVPASMAAQVKTGQPVRLTSQGTPPVTANGTVVFISPYYGLDGDGDSAPNTLMVKAQFPNPQGALKTGQIVQTEIVTSQQQSLAVPVQAVMMQAEQPFVYRVIPLSQALPKIKASQSTPESTKKQLESLPGTTKIVVQTKVELGTLQKDLYPVTSGLKQGDVVAVSNTAMLRSGMPVKVTAAQSGATTAN